MANKKRVFVTGIGLVTPLGIGLANTWDAVLAGKSGAGPITRFNATDYPVTFACEVKNFPAEEFVEKKLLKQMDTFIQYSMAASTLALEHAGFGRPKELGERCGTLIGVGIGGLPELESTYGEIIKNGPRHVSPFYIPRLICNLAAGQVAIMTGAKGPVNCTVTACAASSHAIGDAYRLIERGDADMMITGGAESCICPSTIAGFANMRALSRRNDAPQKASRPFDKDRDGFVVGEGSGILILESEEHAVRRGATAIAEIRGYGSTCDAYHITSPPPEGEGAQRCIRLALKDAGMGPGDIDYINAHGTSTSMNDALETQAIKRVFGERDAKRVKISSTKSMTGHLLGAAGGVEAAFCCLALKNGVIPPTINLENGDPNCDLDYVPNKAVQAPIRNALSNSFGFGGANAALIFSKV